MVVVTVVVVKEHLSQGTYWKVSAKDETEEFKD